MISASTSGAEAERDMARTHELLEVRRVRVARERGVALARMLVADAVCLLGEQGEQPARAAMDTRRGAAQRRLG